MTDKEKFDARQKELDEQVKKVKKGCLIIFIIIGVLIAIPIVTSIVTSMIS